MLRWVWLLLACLLCGCVTGGLKVSSVVPVPLLLTDNPVIPSVGDWPVMPPLPPPDGMRTCCAFGDDLRVTLPGIPAALPFWRLDNVVTADGTGQHHYNDSLFTGLAGERNGLVLTDRGGFVDTAHVRDTADMTVYIFTHLWPRPGQVFTLTPGRAELARRRLVFRAFTPPEDRRERRSLVAAVAARLAYQLAVWHEIAQWYGFESVPGFPEGVSAFSPEDLWSNLLGARIAESLILGGYVESREMYEAAMSTVLQQVLTQLGARSGTETRFRIRMLDGHWWDSRRFLPDERLLLKRNWDISSTRFPTRVPGLTTSPLRLSLRERVGPYRVSALAALQLWPERNMKRLPVPETYYTEADFAWLSAPAIGNGESDSRTGNQSPAIKTKPGVSGGHYH